MATTVPEITDLNTFADKVTDTPAPPGEETKHFRSVDLNNLKARQAEQALAINANVLALTRVVAGADTPTDEDAGKILVSVGAQFSLDGGVETGTAFRILVASAAGMSISGSGGASVTTSIGVYNAGDVLLAWKQDATTWNLVYLHDQAATNHRATGGNPHATTAADVGALALTGGALSGDLTLPGLLKNATADVSIDVDPAGDGSTKRVDIAVDGVTYQLQGSSGRLSIIPASGDAQVSLYDAAAVIRGALQFVNSTGNIQFRRYDSGGSLDGYLEIDANNIELFPPSAGGDRYIFGVNATMPGDLDVTGAVTQNGGTPVRNARVSFGTDITADEDTGDLAHDTHYLIDASSAGVDIAIQPGTAGDEMRFRVSDATNTVQVHHAGEGTTAKYYGNGTASDIPVDSVITMFWETSTLVLVTIVEP